MTYEYLCEECGVLTDVIKSVADLDRREECEHCEGTLSRQFNFNVHFVGSGVESAEYNPGLGAVTKSKYHRSELAKRKGVVEVGSDFGTSNKMQAHYDGERARKRAKSWED